MRAHPIAAAILLCILAGGCARIEVYSDPQMKGEEIGFKFYTSKPYLLVGRPEGGKPVEISLKYLPDLAHPFYAKPRPGWIGSSTLSMTFLESGILSTFNQTTDTKATEMVTALGGFVTSLAAAHKSILEARSGQPLPNEAFFKLYEIVMKDGATTTLVEVAIP